MLPEPFNRSFLPSWKRCDCARARNFSAGRPAAIRRRAAARVWNSPTIAGTRRAMICAISTGESMRAPTGSTSRLFREEVDLFAYVFIDASASMGFPSLHSNICRRATSRWRSSYVILANHDHVKLHFLQDQSVARSQRRRFIAAGGVWRIASICHVRLIPGGALDFAAALGDHLKIMRRPGKAILISDFLMPAGIVKNKGSICCVL